MKYCLNLVYNLVITALPPEITNWTKLLKVAAGNDAVLTCSHNGYPSPTLKWKRGPQVLNGNRYSFTENSITVHVSKYFTVRGVFHTCKSII
jgi:hypothetical protein